MEVKCGFSLILRHSYKTRTFFCSSVTCKSGHRHLSQVSNSQLTLVKGSGEGIRFKSVKLLSCTSRTSPWRPLSNGMSDKRSRQNTQEAKDEPFPSNEGMNLRLSVENDYLSWMRNSYIMTLGGVSMLHFDLWSAGPVAGAAALMTSSLNLLVGTTGYHYNLRSLRQRGCMSALMCRVCQVASILHFLFWGMVLMVIFPEYGLIEISEVDDKDDKS